jgi:hypothetical protein
VSSTRSYPSRRVQAHHGSMLSKPPASAILHSTESGEYKLSRLGIMSCARIVDTPRPFVARDTHRIDKRYALEKTAQASLISQASSIRRAFDSPCTRQCAGSDLVRGIRCRASSWKQQPLAETDPHSTSLDSEPHRRRPIPGSSSFALRSDRRHRRQRTQSLGILCSIRHERDGKSWVPKLGRQSKSIVVVLSRPRLDWIASHTGPPATCCRPVGTCRPGRKQ